MQTIDVGQMTLIRFLCIRSGSVHEVCRKKPTSLHEHRKTTLVYFHVTQIKTFNNDHAKPLEVQALLCLSFECGHLS